MKRDPSLLYLPLGEKGDGAVQTPIARVGASAALVLIMLMGALAASPAAEVGTLEKAGVRGIGFFESADSQFALQAMAMWGGYRDQPARVLTGSVAEPLEAIPVGGYHRQTWRLASPYGDNWSARFTTTLTIATEGEYTFYFQSDDGARMWVGDQQIVDDWVPRSNLISEAKINLTAGEHAVRCEYFERGGSAQAHVRWSGPGIEEQVIPAEVVSADGKPGWKAEYFLNTEELKGEPKTDHHEVLDFNWGDGGPAIFQAGPPLVTMDWARIEDDVIVAQVRGPAKAYVGVVLQGLGPASLGYDVWGNQLVAYAASIDAERRADLHLQALSEGAAYAMSDPTTMPGVWAPGDRPLLFLAGTGELPDLTADAAKDRLQEAMSTGANAPFPALSDDGWAYLFNSRDLAGWHLRHPDGRQSWSVDQGELVNGGAGTDLYSDVRLTDCELHIEFSVPKDSNSGVYLQGRYEVQVHDTFGGGVHPGMCGAIYGQAAPSENVCKPPEEWQTFDITFRGARPSLDGGLASHARITVVQNGVKIIDDVELTSVTGGAMDANEPRAHGIMLQGDHGPVRYRNIRVRPLQ